VRYEAGIIVEKGEEEGLALLFGSGRVRQIRAIHGVPLPQIAEVGPLKAAIGLGALLGEELGGGGATAGELTAQGAWGDAWFGDGVSVVEGEDADDRAGGAERLLTFEGLGTVKGLRGNGAAGAAIGAGLGLETVEALLLIEAFPAGESGGGDAAAGGARDIVVAVGDLLT
jgi:hypothetical protein